MASNRNLVYFFKHFGQKHRLSLRDQHSDSEVWYMHISPLRLLGGLLAVVLMLFIIILTLAAYTPILELIPGYSGNKQREELIHNIMRVDSIERMMNDMELYTSDVSLILDGKTPIVRNVSQMGDSIVVSKPDAVAPNAEDSLLRLQMEGDGPYGLSQTQPRRTGDTERNLHPPLRGVIASRFSPREGRFGVGIATLSSQEIVAVAEGTVTLSAWSPNEGYMVQIQHGDNLLSTYKHLSQSLRAVGSRVGGGEVIGYTGEGVSGEGGKRLLEFELWHNGSPVDPESYIVF